MTQEVDVEHALIAALVFLGAGAAACVGTGIARWLLERYLAPCPRDPGAWTWGLRATSALVGAGFGLVVSQDVVLGLVPGILGGIAATTLVAVGKQARRAP